MKKLHKFCRYCRIGLGFITLFLFVACLLAVALMLSPVVLFVLLIVLISKCMEKFPVLDPMSNIDFAMDWWREVAKKKEND